MVIRNRFLSSERRRCTMRHVIAVFALISLDCQGAAKDTMVVQRYTYLGPEVFEYFKRPEGRESFLLEIGFLFCKDGFVPSSSHQRNAGPWVNTPESVSPEDKAYADMLKSLSGKYIVKLADYTLNDKYSDLKCFPRSSETYAIDGVPYVVVTPNSSGNASSPTPTISISAITPDASETGPTKGEFLISADKAVAKTVTVGLKVSGTAKNGADYKQVAATAKILAGNVSTTVKVTPKNDKQKEATETVMLTLKTSKKYTVGSSNTATVNIADDD